MKDLIERQKAIDEIMKEFKDRSLHDDEETSEDFADGYDEGIRNAATRVYLMPSAEPEIIRCKECAFSVPFSAGGFVCRNMSHAMEENDYCSRAERREE